jgi:hypothetical protein
MPNTKKTGDAEQEAEDERALADAKARLEADRVAAQEPEPDDAEAQRRVAEINARLLGR